MQALVDIVNGGTGSIQRIFAFFIIGGLILAGILTLGATTAAPVVADQIGARAESLGEKAIEAAQEERRAAEMGKDGWGYGESGRRSGTGSTRNADGERVGGWGNE